MSPETSESPIPQATVPQVCREYGVGQHVIYDAIERGELPSAWRSSERGWWRLDPAEVGRWIRSRFRTRPCGERLQ